MTGDRKPAAIRAALVTGGTSGIGRTLALGLAEDGYAVTIAGRDGARAKLVEKQARDAHTELTAVLADMSDERAVVDLVAGHRRRYGRLDVLVNAAGQAMGGVPVEAMPTALVDRQFDVNLRAPFLLSREAIPLLRAAGAEHGNALLLNIASIGGRTRPPGMAIYAATKAGVEALTACNREELAGSGVRVSVFVPAATVSAMAEPFRKMGIADRDMIQPEDLLAALRMLLALSPGCAIPEVQFDSPAATRVIEAAARGL